MVYCYLIFSEFKLCFAVPDVLSVSCIIYSHDTDSTSGTAKHNLNSRENIIDTLSFFNEITLTMKNSFSEIRAEVSSNKKKKQMNYTGCKRVKDWSKDPDDLENYDDSSPEVKHREKQKDERDELIEMFSGLLSDVGTSTSRLQPIFTKTIHSILMEHFEHSDVDTISYFINKYKHLVHDDWLTVAFTQTTRLELRRYLWSIYPQLINKLTPGCLQTQFRTAVIKSDVPMAKFIYEITPPSWRSDTSIRQISTWQ